MIRTALLAIVSTIVFSHLVVAEEPGAEAETTMCERGKLVFSDNFENSLGGTWNVGKGKWEAASGVLSGAEIPSDNHGAVIRTPLKIRNFVIQYSFKLEGAKSTTLSINDPKGHNSRVIITSKGFSIRKDDHDHAGPDQAALLQDVKTPIALGEWHTLTVEFNGPELLATLDGKETAYGSHTAIDVDKSNIGLTVAGQSASFKNLQIWEAQQKTDWPAKKAKREQASSRS